MTVLDESQMLIHNGAGHQFKQGENAFFEHKTLADAKQMFMSALSDTNNLGTCRTSKGLDAENEEMEIELPEAYDFREAYPQCVQTPMSTGDRNCSSSYAFAAIGAVQDKICMATNKTVQLSVQEVLDCDQNSQGCEGGYVNKVLQWGKKKGYVTAECHEYSGDKQECDVDHFETNECRLDNTVYKVNDYCIAVQEENIKRELFKNGPVVAQMQPYTDFLAYKEGSYHRTSESFKFNGQHIVKIIGYQQSIDGSTEWLVENSWGTDWGENGYAKLLGGRGDSGIDTYAIGVAVHPYTLYDYQSAQNMGNAAGETTINTEAAEEDAEQDFNPDDFGHGLDLEAEE